MESFAVPLAFLLAILAFFTLRVKPSKKTIPPKPISSEEQEELIKDLLSESTANSSLKKKKKKKVSEPLPKTSPKVVPVPASTKVEKVEDDLNDLILLSSLSSVKSVKSSKQITKLPQTRNSGSSQSLLTLRSPSPSSPLENIGNSSIEKESNVLVISDEVAENSDLFEKAGNDECDDEKTQSIPEDTKHADECGTEQIQSPTCISQLTPVSEDIEQVKSISAAQKAYEESLKNMESLHESEMSTVLAKLKTLEMDVATLQQTNRTLAKYCQDSTFTITSLKQDVSAASKKNEDLENVNRILNKSNVEKCRDIDVAKRRVWDVEESGRIQIQALNEKCAFLDSTLKQTQKQCATLDDLVGLQKKDIADMSSAKLLLVDELKSLRTENETFRKREFDMEKTLKEQYQRVLELESGLSNFSVRVEELNTISAQKDFEIESLNQEISSIKDSNDSYVSKLKTDYDVKYLEVKVDYEKKLSVVSTETNEKIKTIVADAEKKFKEASETSEQVLKSQVETLTKKIQLQYTNELEMKQKERSIEVGKYKLEVEALRKELDELRQKVSNVQGYEIQKFEVFSAQNSVISSLTDTIQDLIIGKNVETSLNEKGAVKVLASKNDEISLAVAPFVKLQIYDVESFQKGVICSLASAIEDYNISKPKVSEKNMTINSVQVIDLPCSTQISSPDSINVQDILHAQDVVIGLKAVIRNLGSEIESSKALKRAPALSESLNIKIPQNVKYISDQDDILDGMKSVIRNLSFELENMKNTQSRSNAPANIFTQDYKFPPEYKFPNIVEYKSKKQQAPGKRKEKDGNSPVRDEKRNRSHETASLYSDGDCPVVARIALLRLG